MAAFCSNCGAAVVGRFCSCCGKRVRSDIEEFRLAERRTMKEYKKEIFDLFYPDVIYKPSNLELEHVATACWYASNDKIGKFIGGTFGTGYWVMPDAYEKLGAVKQRAIKLCQKIMAEDI